MRRRRALRIVGAGVYQLTIRLAINLATALLFVYFAINSAAVSSRVSAFASEQVAGEITIAQVQWGPDPGRVRLIRPDVRDAEGRRVVSAEWLSVEVSWLTLLQQVTRGAAIKELRVRDIRLAGPKVAVENDSAGKLRLAEAFAPPKPAAPSAESKAQFALIIERLSLQDGRFRMDLNGTQINLAGLQMTGDFRLDIGGETSVRYSYNAVDLKAQRGAMILQSFKDAKLEQLPGGRLAVRSLRGNEREVVASGVRFKSKHTQIKRGDVRVQLAPVVDVQVTGSELASSTEEPFVGKMLGEKFAATSVMTGDVHVTSTGATHVKGRVSGAGKMAGFPTRSVSGQLELHVGDKPGEIVRLVSRDLKVAAFGGQLTSEAFRYRLGTDGVQVSSGKVVVRDLRIAEALTSEGVGMSTAAVASMVGVMDGTLDTKVTLSIDQTKEPALSLTSKVNGTLTLRRDANATMLTKALPTLHMHGAIDTIMTPHSDPPKPLTVVLGQVLVSDRARTDGAPRRAQGATWLFADGEVDVHKQRVELRVDANLPKLAKLLSPFGVKGVSGAVRMDDVGVVGPWLAPMVNGDLKARNIVAGGQKVQRLDTKLELGAGTLKLREVQAVVALGKVAGEIELDLYHKDLTHLRKDMRLRGTNLRVSGLKLGELLAPYNISGIKGQLSLNRVHFSMDLSAPSRSFETRAHVRITRPILRHERLRRLDADVHFGAGLVRVKDLEMEYMPVAIAGLAPWVHGPTVTAARITYALASKRFEVTDLKWPKMEMNRIGELGVLKMPLHGTVAAEVPHAKGNLKDIAFGAKIEMTGLAWDKIYMGDAKLEMRKALGEPAVVTSERFFEKFGLLGGSRVHFKRLVPMWMQAFMQTERMDPMAFLGLPPMVGMRMLGTGRAEFRLDFRPGQPLYSVRFELPKGGGEIELGNGLEPISNLFPATIDVLPDRVKIGSMSLPIGREVIEMCGEFVYPNEAKKRPSILRLFLAGTLDVPRFGALAESMAALDMRLRIAKDPLVDLDKRSRCLKTAAATRGIMRMAGPLDAMAAQGRLELLKSRMTPRGYGKEVVLAGGAKMELTGLGKRKLRIRIPVDARLEGQIEEGRFSTWGQMEVTGYTPQKLNWYFDGTDLAHTVPKEYSVVVSTQTHITGRNLADDARRKMKVTGKVNVTEGNYSKSFDRLGKVISGARGRELETYNEPLFERMPWLGKMEMDLDVDGRDFLVLSRFPFGKTDLELGLDLKVQGTLAQPRIYDRVEIEPGSILTYSVVKRDFEVTRGTIDFKGDPAKGVVDLEAKTEIVQDDTSATNFNNNLSVGPNLAGTGGSGQAQKVTVIIRVSGPLNDPSKLNIELSSIPSYPQGDIQSLILTGALPTQNGQSNGAGEFGSRASIGLLTDDLAEAFSKMLLSAFVDKISIGIPLTGGISARVTTRLGKFLTLSGDYFQNTTQQQMTGRFTFLLPMEGLYLESLLISSIVDGKTESNIFEGRVRYRLTLED